MLSSCYHWSLWRYGRLRIKQTNFVSGPRGVKSCARTGDVAVSYWLQTGGTWTVKRKRIRTKRRDMSAARDDDACCLCRHRGWPVVRLTAWLYSHNTSHSEQRKPLTTCFPYCYRGEHSGWQSEDEPGSKEHTRWGSRLPEQNEGRVRCRLTCVW
jgi:hypothetical protein